MELLIGVFIFCVVLFVYLHVNFQLRTSDDLEVYEVEDVAKNRLEEICDLRQPVIVDYHNPHISESITRSNLETTYPAFEVKIRNVAEIGTDDVFLPLQMREATKLLGDGNRSQYYSENNTDFLQDTGSIKSMKYNDEYIRPYMVSNCNYDVMFGAEGVCTPFRYEINYRNYFYITEGDVVIKLAPPKSSKYLAEYEDYENFEFRSSINPWNVQPTYRADFDKVKCLEVKLTAGKLIYIPPYWWYSIQFGKGSTIACFRYRTYMNNMAILPRLVMYMLQNQNIKRDVVRKVHTLSPDVTDTLVPPDGTETTDAIEEKNDSP